MDGGWYLCKKHVDGNCSQVRKWYWGDQTLKVKTESQSLESKSQGASISICTVSSYKPTMTRVILSLMLFRSVDMTMYEKFCWQVPDNNKQVPNNDKTSHLVGIGSDCRSPIVFPGNKLLVLLMPKCLYHDAC